ncbi:uncharacterized protein N7479_001374 [Penicillium vulpinum]|uniref:Uncharacterized protein n=1 Tax=Penicillium vulpinum TaxID=29845 RepID=A0A1V6RUJ6_9EURO|nr:uncharacterized protein N7479_001374 [Penicillium vulpinum]KAJ5971456.1 hypothetical protein N7479_001374 [Penicillium vulpinum]OQE05174.1 hypothetical protein PENVUL_c026G08317 [Penicillium vulpinum]
MGASREKMDIYEIQIPDSHEILVHIGAASTAQDDARYWAQVAAILEFQCASRQPLMESNSPGPDRDHPHPFSADAAVHSSVPWTTQHEALPILREALRPAYITLSSDPLSVLERDGVTPREHIISNHSDSRDSLGSLISVIPDSQPEIAQGLVHAETSYAALSPPSQLAPPPPRKRRRTAPASPDPANPVLIAHETPIPTPPANQPAVSHSVTLFQNNPTSFPQTPIEISSSAQDEERPGESITHPATPSLPIPANANPPNPITLSTLPFEIHPPRPPISTSPFTTHITPTLSMLTERLNPARTYKPSTQSRPLDPLERGYWFMHFAIEPPQHQNRDPPDLLTDPTPTSTPGLKPGTTSLTPNAKPKENLRSWPSPFFHAFWSFLSDFVGRDGRAGWGVWCILEAATPAPSTISSDMHVSLKVYAWGEVAMHVYLLLFLASERRIRGMGVQWRDAGEDVVIQMP